MTSPVIVPDLHGELGLLRQVLERFPERDFVFLGDLIDRGPDSPGTVSAVIELAEAGRATVLLGNHEAMWIDAVVGENDDAMRCWLSNGGQLTLDQYRQGAPELFTRHLGWLMRHAHHWLTVDTPQGPVLCAHASRPRPELVDLLVPPGKQDQHLWRGQSAYSGPHLPPGYAYSVHGHVPQVKPPAPRWVQAAGGKFLLLDIGSCFNGQVAVLDTEDLSLHTFQNQETP